MKYNGFTLIELLIVMAILGIMATIILVLINPLDKMARANDTGRISTVTQLGHAIDAYYVSSNSVYPDSSNWANLLVSSGNPSSFPAGIKYLSATRVTSCLSKVQPATDSSYCYDIDTLGTNGAIVFSKLEATSKLSLCASPEVPYFVYSTADGRAGTVCSEDDPVPWVGGSQTYVQ